MQVMIRYKVRPDQVERNRELLRDVFAELESLRPRWLRDAIYQLDDGVSYVQFVELDGGPDLLSRLPAFQRYRAGLDERCDEPSAVTVLHVVASYRPR